MSTLSGDYFTETGLQFEKYRSELKEHVVTEFEKFRELMENVDEEFDIEEHEIPERFIEIFRENQGGDSDYPNSIFESMKEFHESEVSDKETKVTNDRKRDWDNQEH